MKSSFKNIFSTVLTILLVSQAVYTMQFDEDGVIKWNTFDSENRVYHFESLPQGSFFDGSNHAESTFNSEARRASCGFVALYYAYIFSQALDQDSNVSSDVLAKTSLDMQPDEKVRQFADFLENIYRDKDSTLIVEDENMQDPAEAWINGEDMFYVVQNFFSSESQENIIIYSAQGTLNFSDDIDPNKCIMYYLLDQGEKSHQYTQPNYEIAQAIEEVRAGQRGYLLLLMPEKLPEDPHWTAIVIRKSQDKMSGTEDASTPELAAGLDIFLADGLNHTSLSNLSESPPNNIIRWLLDIYVNSGFKNWVRTEGKKLDIGSQLWDELSGDEQKKLIEACWSDKDEAQWALMDTTTLYGQLFSQYNIETKLLVRSFLSYWFNTVRPNETVKCIECNQSFSSSHMPVVLPCHHDHIIGSSCLFKKSNQTSINIDFNEKSSIQCASCDKLVSQYFVNCINNFDNIEFCCAASAGIHGDDYLTIFKNKYLNDIEVDSENINELIIMLKDAQMNDCIYVPRELADLGACNSNIGVGPSIRAEDKKLVLQICDQTGDVELNNLVKALDTEDVLVIQRIKKRLNSLFSEEELMLFASKKLWSIFYNILSLKNALESGVGGLSADQGLMLPGDVTDLGALNDSIVDKQIDVDHREMIIDQIELLVWHGVSIAHIVCLMTKISSENCVGVLSSLERSLRLNIQADKIVEMRKYAQEGLIEQCVSNNLSNFSSSEQYFYNSNFTEFVQGELEPRREDVYRLMSKFLQSLELQDTITEDTIFEYFLSS